MPVGQLNTEHWPRRLALLSLLLVCLIPLAHMLYLIVYESSSCLSFDYATFTPCVDKFFHIKANINSLIDFLQSVYYGQHFLLVQALSHALQALLSKWNTQSEMIFGLLLAVLRCEFMSQSVFRSSEKTLRHVFFCLCLLMVFGTTNSSSFLNGQPAISTGWVLLLFSLIVALVLNYKAGYGTKIALFVLFVASLVSALVGPYVCVFALGAAAMCTLVRQNKSFWSVLIAAGITCSILVVLIMMGRPTHVAPSNSLDLRPLVFLGILGRPFHNTLAIDFGAHNQSIILGALFFPILAATLFVRKAIKDRCTDYIGALCFVAYGLGLSFITSLARATIAPWYSIFAQVAWLGLVALLLPTLRREAGKWRIYGAFALGSIGIFHALANVSDTDKNFYHNMSTPVSSSVLRNYLSAPTYGENFLNAGNKSGEQYLRSLAQPAERNCWSVFANRQLWLLQGDYLLNNVSTKRNVQEEQPFWISANKITAPKDFKSSRHLNLCLPPNSSLSWQLTLPREVKNIDFVSILFAAKKSTTDGLQIRIEDQQGKCLQQQEIKAKSGTPILLDLKIYAGSNINLVLQSKSKAAVLQVPRMQINLIRSNASDPAMREYCPSNRLPAQESLPATSYIDFDLKNWKSSGLRAVTNIDGGISIETMGKQDFLEYSQALSLPVSHLKCLGIVINAAPPKEENGYEVLFQFSTDQGRLINGLLPVTSDGKSYAFTYDLRALDFTQTEKITGIKIYPCFDEVGGKMVLKRFLYQSIKD